MIAPMNHESLCNDESSKCPIFFDTECNEWKWMDVTLNTPEMTSTLEEWLLRLLPEVTSTLEELDYSHNQLTQLPVSIKLLNFIKSLNFC